MKFNILNVLDSQKIKNVVEQIMKLMEFRKKKDFTLFPDDKRAQATRLYFDIKS